jgi:hypothetical protein
MLAVITMLASFYSLADQAGAASNLPGPLSITSTNLPAGRLGDPYSATLTATGGTQPYTWSLNAGALPEGLALDPTTGAITGTPTAPGGSNFTAQVTDSTSDKPQSTTQDLSVTIAAPLDGAGTVSVDPDTVHTSSNGPLTFTYTAGDRGLEASGEVAIVVADGWAAPSGTPKSPGSVSVQPAIAIVSIAGRLITVTGVALGAGQTLTVIYGGNAPVAPGSPEASMFPTSERFDADGALTALASGSPAVSVTGAGSRSLLIITVAIVALLAILAAALVTVVRRVRRRPVPPSAPQVRAIPHPGTSDVITVEKVGGDVTVTVSIDPHPGEATITVEKV